MPNTAFEPCIPTKATILPDRPEWIHEIKHDGPNRSARLQARAAVHPQRPRLERPIRASSKLRSGIGTARLIDGEAVLLGVDGISDLQRAALPQVRIMFSRFLLLTMVSRIDQRA